MWTLVSCLSSIPKVVSYVSNTFSFESALNLEFFAQNIIKYMFLHTTAFSLIIVYRVDYTNIKNYLISNP